MVDAQGNPGVSHPIGTSPSGSKALVAFLGILWTAWIGFLLFILMTRS